MHISKNGLKKQARYYYLKITKEIVLIKPLETNPPSPTVQIEQVSQAGLLGVLLIPSYSMLTHVNYITGITNQRLYW